MESLTQQQSASRVVSHNKITDLTNGFKLENEHSFTIFVVKKSNINGSVITADNDSHLLVSAKLIQDDVFSLIPVRFNDWDLSLIKELGPAAIDTLTYDVYWGSGYRSQS